MYVNPEIRRTKIVATIGPACDDPETLKAMIAAGMNVARLNLSHGSYEEHATRLKRIRRAARESGAWVAIMVDTRGIEIRTGQLPEGNLTLNTGDAFTLYTGEPSGEPGKRAPVSYRKLPGEVEEGTALLLDDGAIETVITEVNSDNIVCTVIHGGVLGDRKSINLPDTVLSVSSVSPEFREEMEREIAFAAGNGVDYLAASFVQTGEEVDRIREILQRHGQDIPIIAKIENKAGVRNLDEIVSRADGIMVARGDLGVELPLAEVPGAQKRIIRATVMNGRPVITATQMLASMETNPKPTRAEASDVANAILDGSSAVMLSGETAVGRYPVKAVSTMASIALRAEASLREFGFLQAIQADPSNKITEAVGQSAVNMAGQLQAKAIISLTETGFTARLVSKHRPECPILALTSSREVAHRLAMNWGVVPMLYDGPADANDDTRAEFGCERAREAGYVSAGDIVVITHGQQQHAGGTDLIRVVTIA